MPVAERVVMGFDVGHEALRELQLAPLDDTDCGAQIVGIFQNTVQSTAQIEHAVARLVSGAKLESINERDVTALAFRDILRTLRAELAVKLVFVCGERRADSVGLTVFRNVHDAGFAEGDSDDEGTSDSEDEAFGEASQSKQHGRKGGAEEVAEAEAVTPPSSPSRAFSATHHRRSKAAWSPAGTLERALSVSGRASSGPLALEDGEATNNKLSALSARFTAMLERQAVESEALRAEVEELKAANSKVTGERLAAEAEVTKARAEAAHLHTRIANARISSAAVDDSKLVAVTVQNATAQRLDSVSRDLDATVRKWQASDHRATLAEAALARLRTECSHLRQILTPDDNGHNRRDLPPVGGGARAESAGSSLSFFVTKKDKTRSRREVELDRLAHRLLQGNQDRDEEISSLRSHLAKLAAPPPRAFAQRTRQSRSCAPNISGTTATTTTTTAPTTLRSPNKAPDPATKIMTPIPDDAPSGS